MGDAAGIGPEICLKAAQEKIVRNLCHPLIIGDACVLEKVARRCQIKPLNNVISPERFLTGETCFPAILDLNLLQGKKIKPGTVQSFCGYGSFLYIKTAVSLALAKKVAAIVTGPICKEALHLAGYRYPGHTEILMELTGAKQVCMMLASEKIICSLVTTHTSLAKVSGLLSVRDIVKVIELSREAIRRLKGKEPVLAVCGLNPHAGEGGIFGNEEKKFILPAISQARRKGVRVTGPWPADTAFLPQKVKRTDGYICMYHDQGLIPFKMLSFAKGVNITLGLPIIRTSVDHGTAFDLAWKGKASPLSLREAIRYAVLLSGKTKPACR